MTDRTAELERARAANQAWMEQYRAERMARDAAKYKRVAAGKKAAYTRKRNQLLGVPTEAQEQRLLVAWLEARSLNFFSVPNEGKRSRRHGAHMRAQGLTAGAPDIVVTTPARSGMPTAVEMKRSKGGRVSDSQREMHEVLERDGWNVVVGYGFEDARSKLEGLY